MSSKKYSKPQRAIAKEILTELERQYKVVKANSAMNLFYVMRDYIQQTYLSEDKH